MDVAALILATLSLLASGGCLVLLLAKRFSTHRVEYVNQQTTLVEWDTPGSELDAPPAAQRASLDAYQREQRLVDLEHTSIGDGLDDF